VYQFFIKLPKVLVFSIILHGIAWSVQGQNSRAIDSLLQLVNQSEGIDKFSHLLRLGIEYRSIDKTQSIQFLTAAKDLAYQNGDTLKIVRGARVLGEILRRFERNEEAEKILTEILPVVRRNNQEKDLKFILNSLALIHSYQAEYDKALNYNFESLLLREQ
jgi:tetratricopeptide (TPR) repeat protein